MIEQASPVAFYSSWKALAMLFFLLLLAGILLFGWYEAISDPGKFFRFGAYRTYCIVLGSLLYSLYLPRFWIFARQVLLRKMSAVWVEGGKLIYIDPDFFDIRCSDIAAISLELFGPYGQEGIAIVLKDGGKKILPTGLLSTPASEVAEKLRKICQLRLTAN